MTGRIEIQKSKSKLMVLSIISVLIFLASIILAFLPDSLITPVFGDHLVIIYRIIQTISALSFGALSLWFTKKLLDGKPGLIIDELGIHDRSSGLSVGLIEWDDITGIKTYTFLFRRTIILQTNKPEQYINKASNWLAKTGMKSNYKMCGSPLTINSKVLKISHERLTTIISDQWIKYRS